MADRSKIEWTDSTWNPIRAHNRATGKVGWHCEHASPGCEHCYSAGFNARLGTGMPFKPGHRADVDIFLDPAMLTQPLRWTRPRMIFVCSMTDLFADFVPDEIIDRVFAVMALCPQHTFQVLTKRSARMRAYLTRGPGGGKQDVQNHIAWVEVAAVLNQVAPHWGSEGIDGPWRRRGIQACTTWPLPNVWLGVSAEDQRRADERVPDLLATPAAVRFVSAEPLLGPIDFEVAWHGENALDAECWGDCAWCRSGHPALHNCHCGLGDWEKGRSGLDWIIVGGESGRDARPMHPDWARSIRDQCAAAGVAFFFKQWGEWAFEGQTASQPGASFFSAAGEPVDEKPPFGPSTGSRWHWWEPDHLASYRIGKKAAGRRLDGVEHNGMPQAAAAPLAGAA